MVDPREQAMPLFLPWLHGSRESLDSKTGIWYLRNPSEAFFRAKKGFG